MIDLEAIFEDISPRGGQVSPPAAAGASGGKAAQASAIADSGNENGFASSRLGVISPTVGGPEKTSASVAQELRVSSPMSQRSAALNPGNGRDAPGRPAAPGNSPQYPNSPGNSGNAPGQTGTAGRPDNLPPDGGPAPGQIEAGAPPQGTPGLDMPAPGSFHWEVESLSNDPVPTFNQNVEKTRIPRALPGTFKFTGVWTATTSPVLSLSASQEEYRASVEVRIYKVEIESSSQTFKADLSPFYCVGHDHQLAITINGGKKPKPRGYVAIWTPGPTAPRGPLPDVEHVTGFLNIPTDTRKDFTLAPPSPPPIKITGNRAEWTIRAVRVGNEAELFVQDVEKRHTKNGRNLALLRPSAGTKTRGAEVVLELNSTLGQADDLTALTATMAQPLPVNVTLHGLPLGTVDLTVVPAGDGSITDASVTLQDGKNKGTTFIPTAVSGAANGTEIHAKLTALGHTEEDCAKENLTVVRVDVPPRIRAASTPAAMVPDRIPPRVPTPEQITVTPDLGATGQFVMIIVEGQSAAHGRVTIDGGANAPLTTTRVVNLSAPPDGQTAIMFGADAGFLHLTAQVRGAPVAQSAGFSVAAIPMNFRQTSGLPGGTGGLFFLYSWDSDSGDRKDLNGVYVGEHVTYSSADDPYHPPNPPFQLAGGASWSLDNPTVSPEVVPNGTSVLFDDQRFLGAVGGTAVSFTATQHFRFYDFRTMPNGSSDARKMLAWGLVLSGPISVTRSVLFLGPQGWVYEIEKSGVKNRVVLP